MWIWPKPIDCSATSEEFAVHHSSPDRYEESGLEG